MFERSPSYPSKGNSPTRRAGGWLPLPARCRGGGHRHNHPRERRMSVGIYGPGAHLRAPLRHAAMIRAQRLTATLDGGFVVFLIGMADQSAAGRASLVAGDGRDAPKWSRSCTASPNWVPARRNVVLAVRPSWCSTGDRWSSCWTSQEQGRRPLPAWRAFNQRWARAAAWASGTKPMPCSRGLRNIYVNMPPFGLGRSHRFSRWTAAFNILLSQARRRREILKAAVPPAETCATRPRPNGGMFQVDVFVGPRLHGIGFVPDARLPLVPPALVEGAPGWEVAGRPLFLA